MNKVILPYEGKKKYWVITSEIGFAGLYNSYKERKFLIYGINKTPIEEYYWVYPETFWAYIYNHTEKHPFLFNTKSDAVVYLKSLSIKFKCKIEEVEFALYTPKMATIKKSDLDSVKEKTCLTKFEIGDVVTPRSWLDNSWNHTVHKGEKMEVVMIRECDNYGRGGLLVELNYRNELYVCRTQDIEIV